MTLDPIRGLERLLRWGCGRPSLTFAKGKCPTIERYCLTQEPFFRERFLFPSAAIVSLAWPLSWQIPDQKTSAGSEFPSPQATGGSPIPAKKKSLACPYRANPRSKNIRGQQNSRPLRRPKGAPPPRSKSLWPALTGQIPDQKTPAGSRTPVPSGDRREPHPREVKVFGLPFFRKVGKEAHHGIPV